MDLLAYFLLIFIWESFDPYFLLPPVETNLMTEVIHSLLRVVD